MSSVALAFIGSEKFFWRNIFVMPEGGTGCPSHLMLHPYRHHSRYKNQKPFAFEQMEPLNNL
jgi:hypothetical protein